MTFTLTEGHFTTEAEAFAEIADRGWHAVVLDVPAEEDELHWHDFDSVAFVVEGTARSAFEDGGVLEAGAGTRVEAPAGVVHRAVSPAYRAVFGFSIDPTEMTRPVNKPPADRP